MIDRLDITDEYSVNCDFMLNTVIFIDAALNISLRKIRKCNVLSFYLFGQGDPNETKGTINLKEAWECGKNNNWFKHILFVFYSGDLFKSVSLYAIEF